VVIDREPETITSQKLAEQLKSSQDIIIVPGYGMAVARCQ